MTQASNSPITWAYAWLRRQSGRRPGPGVEGGPAVGPRHRRPSQRVLAEAPGDRGTFGRELGYGTIAHAASGASLWPRDRRDTGLLHRVLAGAGPSCEGRPLGGVEWPRFRARSLELVKRRCAMESEAH